MPMTRGITARTLLLEKYSTSGRKSLAPRYRKTPAERAKSEPTSSSPKEEKYTKEAPTIVTEADSALTIKIFLRLHPAFRRIPKSPISCGTSCSSVEIAVTKPSPGETK